MSLAPKPILEVPEETVRIAQAAFPKGNSYIRMRDRLGVFFEDDQNVNIRFKCPQIIGLKSPLIIGQNSPVR